jgi:OCT family organic cation transporter-like MFS transporter 18
MAPPVDSTTEKYVWLIYLLVVFYALCYQLQAPLEPFLVDRLVGADKDNSASSAYARLQSFFNIVQAIGSLTFGYILDRAGARVGFIVNFCACAMTYFLLANTTSLTILYLSKVPGIGMAGFLCAQTAVSQITADGKPRTIALGRLTTAYTIGGVIGPYTGGLLGAKGDYFLGAKIAAFGSLIAAGLCCLLPTSKGAAKVKDSTVDKDKGASVSTKSSWIQRATLVMKTCGFLILMKLVTSTANSMSSSTQSLILKNELGFSEANLGFFLSCQFAFGGFANGFLLDPITQFLGGQVRMVARNCIAIMAAGYFLQSVLRSETLGLLSFLDSKSQTFIFIGVAMFLSLFQYSLGTSITSENTQLVDKDMKGTLIGFEHCIFSAARIFTPAIGVGILNSAGAGSLYMVCGSIFLTCFTVWVASAPLFLPANGEKKNG